MSLLSKLAFTAIFCMTSLLVVNSALATEPRPAEAALTNMICQEPSKYLKPPPYRYQRCSIKPQGICTRDVNQCGNASACQCPLGYIYNAVTGTCDWSFEYHRYPVIWFGETPELPSEPSDSTTILSPACERDVACVSQPIKCTSDTNDCGYPSRCKCEAGYFYNPATGMCNLILR